MPRTHRWIVPSTYGVTVYVTQTPMIACDEQNWQTDKGCVVQHAFSA